MDRGMDQCGGETSSTDMINEHGNLTLALLLPRGCLAAAEGPKSGRLAASGNL